jgi:hypothetical protein
MDNIILLQILERFCNKYKYLRYFRKKEVPSIEEIEFLDYSFRDCVYSVNERNERRKNIKIIYRYRGEKIRLSVLFDDYSDLLIC